MVYNRGEMVEGHSDPSWVFMLAAIIRAGIVDRSSPWTLLWTAKILSALFGVGSIVGAYVLASKVFRGSYYRRYLQALVVFSIAVCSPFVLWSVGALEMTLVACCYTFGMVFLFDVFDESFVGSTTLPLLLTGICFAVASLTRPEPACITAVVFLLLLLTNTDRKRTIMLCIAPYALIMLLFELWRWNTYHDLLPNTFYAKTGGGLSAMMMGLKYTMESFGGIGGLLLITIPFAFDRNTRNRKILYTIGAIIAATSFFAIYSGGDWMPGFRFFIPVAPLMVILGVVGLENILTMILKNRAVSWNTLRAVFVASAIGMMHVFAMRVLLRGQQLTGSDTAVSGFRSIVGYSLFGHKELADWIATHMNANEVYATGEAGLIGYLNPTLRMLDLQGLTDKHIASDRRAGRPFDCNYILQCSPKYVIIDRAEYQQANSFYATLYNYSPFQQAYALAVKLKNNEVFIRRDAKQ